MYEPIASYEGRFAKVEGPIQSGKTEALLFRVETLLKAGVNSATIAVTVGSTYAAVPFLQKLIELFGESAAEITVVTPLELCRKVLELPEAREATGRTPRLLAPHEIVFLTTDLRFQAKAPELRSFLARFEALCCNNTPLNRWPDDEEFAAIHALLTNYVEQNGVMMPEETPFLCHAYLREHSQTTRTYGFDYLLCDDFQNYTKAEQEALELLAGRQFMVFGNVNETARSRSKLPNPGGFAHFSETHDNCESFTLTVPTDVPERFCLKWDTPESELKGIARYTRTFHDSDYDGYEGRLCILVPNRIFARQAETFLRKVRLKNTFAGVRNGFGGDPREREKATAALAWTRLSLLADPHDSYAWRCWCGFGNKTLNGIAWKNLLAWAQERGITPVGALAEVHDALDKDGKSFKDELPSKDMLPFEGADALAKRYREGLKFITAYGSARGFSLLHGIDPASCEAFESLRSVATGDEDPKRLMSLMDPTIGRTRELPRNAVLIAEYDALCGLNFDYVFTIALVRGLLPKPTALGEEKSAARERSLEKTAFEAATGKAHRELLLSYFTKMPAETAESLHIPPARMKQEHGKQMAMLRPCDFFAEAGDDFPSTDSGQSFLTDHGLKVSPS